MYYYPFIHPAALSRLFLREMIRWCESCETPWRSFNRTSVVQRNMFLRMIRESSFVDVEAFLRRASCHSQYIYILRFQRNGGTHGLLPTTRCRHFDAGISRRRKSRCESGNVLKIRMAMYWAHEWKVRSRLNGSIESPTPLSESWCTYYNYDIFFFFVSNQRMSSENLRLIFDKFPSFRKIGPDMRPFFRWDKYGENDPFSFSSIVHQKFIRGTFRWVTLSNLQWAGANIREARELSLFSWVFPFSHVVLP